MRFLARMFITLHERPVVRPSMELLPSRLRILCDFRRHVVFAACLGEALTVMGLVCGHHLALGLAGHNGEHLRGHVALCRAFGLTGAQVDHLAAPVVADHDVAQVERQSLRRIVLSGQPTLVVCSRFIVSLLHGAPCHRGNSGPKISHCLPRQVPGTSGSAHQRRFLQSDEYGAPGVRHRGCPIRTGYQSCHQVT